VFAYSFPDLLVAAWYVGSGTIFMASLVADADMIFLSCGFF